MRFKIDWASNIVGSKFTVFSLSKYESLGGLYLEGRGDLTEGFLIYLFGGLIYMEGLIFGI